MHCTWAEFKQSKSTMNKTFILIGNKDIESLGKCDFVETAGIEKQAVSSNLMKKNLWSTGMPPKESKTHKGVNQIVSQKESSIFGNHAMGKSEG